MEEKGGYTEEDKEKFSVVVKKGGAVRTTVRNGEDAWKEGDPTLPDGWKIRNNYWGNIERQTFMSPSGKFFFLIYFILFLILFLI